jgi:tRNA dimethylallyltransferase
LSGDSGGAEVGVICGPTAAGKSALALSIAARLPVTIIVADSRQIYRSFDIGTAKPTADDQRQVPHRGLDVADPCQRWSAGAWSQAAGGWIEEAARARRIPLVVGGTGLYVRALFDGLAQPPPLDADRRERLRVVLSHLASVELRRWVARLDPPRASLGRAQLVRAVETALLSGRRLSDCHRAPPPVARWTARYLVVDPGAVLASRIESRTDEMLANGWCTEVERLMSTVPADAPAWTATGYDAVRALVRGMMTHRAAREAIVTRTRQYAKRQRTWFRHQLPADRVTRVNPLESAWEGPVTRWLSGLTRSPE